MAIVIRTLYNNVDWKSRCRKPYQDINCLWCYKENRNVDIQAPNPTDEICSGECWEQNLCVSYRWGCTPKGKIFGRRASPGTKVFFAYQQENKKLYTIWGRTYVKAKDKEPNKDGNPVTEQGWSFIHFEPFDPLPNDKWVRNLTDRDLVEEKWLMGRHRYINEDLGNKLERGAKVSDSIILPKSITISLSVTPTINDRLDRLSTEEGRNKEDIIREAIAELLKNRVV